MKRGNDRNIRTECAPVTDRDIAVILHREIEICKKAVAYFSMSAVMKKYRTLHETIASHRTDKLFKNRTALFRFILRQSIVFKIEVVSPELHCLQRRISRAKQHSAFDFFFLCHYQHLISIVF